MPERTSLGDTLYRFGGGWHLIWKCSRGVSAKNVLPSLESSLPSDRPSECTASMASVLSILCLAEAQAVTVRKAEEKFASDTLLAKLHYGVAEFLKEVSRLLEASSGDWNDASDKFKRYINLC